MKMAMYLPNGNTIKPLESKECEKSLRSKFENKRTKTYRYDLKKLGFNFIKQTLLQLLIVGCVRLIWSL